MLKKCSKCGLEKEVTEFAKRKDRKSGIYSSCLLCKRKYKKVKYDLDKFEDPINLWVKRNTIGVRWRAKKNNIDYELEIPFVKKLLEEQEYKCVYCQKEFNFNSNTFDKFLSPTFDRIIPNFGYLLDNVAISCYRCNSIKNNATFEELDQISKSLKNLILNIKK